MIKQKLYHFFVAIKGCMMQSRSSVIINKVVVDDHTIVDDVSYKGRVNLVPIVPKKRHLVVKNVMKSIKVERYL